MDRVFEHLLCSKGQDVSINRVIIKNTAEEYRTPVATDSSYRSNKFLVE